MMQSYIAIVLGTVIFIFIATMGGIAAELADNYAVYDPVVERNFVYDFRIGSFKYNHCSSLAWYMDRWFAVWNANTDPREGCPGQIIALSTSSDFVHWSSPVEPFNDPVHCDNPVDTNGVIQWQPNLVVVGEELWCVWSQIGTDEAGTYVSKLTSPEGKWTNQLLLFKPVLPALSGLRLPQSLERGSTDPIIEGQRWRLFPTQNPIVLSSGRILAPVTAQSSPVQAPPPGIDGWLAVDKRNLVLITDDGLDWRVSGTTTQPHKTWAVWEPTVWELADGSIRMFSRNNDPRTKNKGGDSSWEMLLTSYSKDGGETWTSAMPVPIETISSRMHVLPLDGFRYVMVHNDYRKDLVVEDRLNLALFFSRAGTTDFVPGVNISGKDVYVAYPQMFLRDNSLYVIYSQANSRSIKTAKISPLPNPNSYYILPRRNTLAACQVKANDEGLLDYTGFEYLDTGWKQPEGLHSLSLGFWLKAEGPGTIFDSRGGGNGVLVHLRVDSAGRLVPNINLGTSQGDIATDIQIPWGEWTYLGISIDCMESYVEVVSGGKSDIVTYSATPNLVGQTAYLGYKRFSSSMVPGFLGQIQSACVHPGTVLSVVEHCRERDRLSTSLGFYVKSIFSDWNHLIQDEEIHWLEQVDWQGAKAIRLCGEASAGIELPLHDLKRGMEVSFGMEFWLESSDSRTTIATFGYADQPARIILNGRDVFLVAGSSRQRLGQYEPEVWNKLEITVADEVLSVCLNDNTTGSTEYKAQYLLAYLGQGYLQGRISPNECILINIETLYSRVD